MNRIELLICVEQYHKLEQFLEQLCYDLNLEKTYYSNIVSASEFLFERYSRYYERFVLEVVSSYNEEGLGLKFRLVGSQESEKIDFLPKLSEAFGLDLASVQTICDRCTLDEQKQTVFLLFNTTAQFGTKAQRRIDLLTGYLEKQKQRCRAIK